MVLFHSFLQLRRQWHPTPVLLPGKSHGWRSLVGCSPWGREESDMTERLHFHFHALEKEMATHSSVLAWRILGMGERRLKRLSSSSSSIPLYTPTHTHISHIFFIYSSVNGHLICFHLLAIVNSAAVNVGVHVSFQIRIFVFFCIYA